ncbi:MAG: DUF2267 domain-containing protein [Myxococcaceae bacterium]|nr:DUF2267 domain-containing protein [Myxococcaceae bacterium]MCI0669177.1 DUF2267 domain-containing protein [Myxococcaceae bacterium]
MAILEGTPGEVSWSGQGVGTDRTSFLAKVSARLAGEEPVEAAEAVFCTLSQHLSGGVVSLIHDALTEDVRDILKGCGHPAGKDDARAFDKDEFYAAVAEHLNVEPADVRRILSAVFAGLHSQITESIADKVAAQLPADLRSTWEHARRGVAAPH